MSDSILNHKTILVVDDESDVLEVVKGEILFRAPTCSLDTATTYQKAIQLLATWTYDLAILDIMGVRGFDLLQEASALPTPVPAVMLTAHAFSPESLRKAVQLGARAYLPKERLGAVVPFLEDVLTYEYGAVWKRILKQVEGAFNEAWGPYWRKPDEDFWKEFERRIEDERK